MCCEFVGGYISHSLSIMADAAHMFSDVAGFMISFFSIYISQKKSTIHSSMGHHRAEIIGALMSIFIIWGLLGYLNYMATMRIINPPEQKIDADVMIITACIGFGCNIINFVALNMSCGSVPEEDDTDSVEHSRYSDNLHHSVSEQLMSVYLPHQAHKCIRAQSTHGSNIDDDEE